MELIFVGRARREMKDMPKAVQQSAGQDLFVVQLGGRPASAKTLSGFGDASVVELKKDHDGNAYRVIYTVRFDDRVYVLTCFQKKSRSGSATPTSDVKRIESRLAEAKKIHEAWKKKP